MIVKTTELSKKFGENLAVDSVNLSIGQGQVYGFIGMNGAGKSTTIKMLSGLISPSGGRIELFGESNAKGIKKARGRISGYVDTPAFYWGMTAIQNLEIIGRLQKKKKRWSLKEILMVVDLESDANKAVAKFSLGMKQRLAIGAALVNNPDLIILDEPVNGLDPNGIIEIRDLITNLSEKYGITFLISSHILSELEKVATNYGIINRGRLIEQISAVELKKRLKPYILVEGNAINQIQDALLSELKITNSKAEGNKLLISDSMERFNDIKNLVNRIDAQYNSVKYETQSLESYFVDLVGGTRNAIDI